MYLSRKDKIEIVENAISWIVVLGMFIYGVAKFMQFDGATEVDKTVSEMTGMELMWAFYGYSKAFALIIGFLEVTGGLLILIKKTRLIGCLFTSTILVNIILQDIFYGVHLGALKAAMFYQLMILFVLWMNREQLIKSLKNLLMFSKVSQTKRHLFLKLLMAFILFTLLRIVEYYLTIKI